MIKTIDTFKDFKACFEDNLNISVGEKIDLWDKLYIHKYPELEEKCKSDYESDGYSWREIASSMVFNRTKDDFNKMLEAYTNIKNSIQEINNAVKQVFNIEPNLYIVLYCGLCNSAGWVDTYNHKRAILYGIDKIAELNWHTIEKVKPLIAHELCHVIHFEIRGEDKLTDIDMNNYSNGIWRIYEEGFAQYYQQKLIGDVADSRGIEWLKSCIVNKSTLKALYLEALHNKSEGTKHFFGDWFKVMNISDTGYFLGTELIKELNEILSMEQIAKLNFNDIENAVIQFLKK